MPPLIPIDLEKRGTALLHQQCWAWGRDVVRPAGNLLSIYGFTRHRPPAGVVTSSRYDLDLHGGRWISLWGWGMQVGSRERGAAIMLARQRFQPRYHDASGPAARAWKPDDLPRFELPHHRAQQEASMHLLIDALRWLAEYEAWVLREAGEVYRDRVIDAWKRAAIPGRAMAAAWRGYLEALIAKKGIHPDIESVAGRGKEWWAARSGSTRPDGALEAAAGQPAVAVRWNGKAARVEA